MADGIELEKIKEEGTVKPVAPFHVSMDCEALRKAMKGLGRTDEDAIIKILAHRTNEQRQTIAKMYESKYEKNMVKQLKHETSFNFENILVAMCMNPTEFDCTQFKKCIKGSGLDGDYLIEICCTRSTAELELIKRKYKELYGTELVKDVDDKTKDPIEDLILALLQAKRPDTGNEVNRADARKDAEHLYEADKKTFHTKGSRFFNLLSSRSFPQLRAMFEEYKKACHRDIDDVITEAMIGDVRETMLTVVRCIRNKDAQFARSLHNSMKGSGTKDESLIRVVVSRSEVDMVQIKQHFERAYKKPLGQWIKEETSGDYCQTLLHLIAAEDMLKKSPTTK